MISNLNDITKLINFFFKTYFYALMTWNQIIPDVIDQSPSKTAMVFKKKMHNFSLLINLFK
jgi:hypothetical protein